MSFLAQSGALKGCEAVEIDAGELEESLLQRHANYSSRHEYFEEERKHSREDYRRIARTLRRMKLRRAVPAWSVPPELFAMIMLPDRRKRSERTGVGGVKVGVCGPTEFASGEVEPHQKQAAEEAATDFGHQMDVPQGSHQCDGQ